jgi:hypothetical protein
MFFQYPLGEHGLQYGLAGVEKTLLRSRERLLLYYPHSISSKRFFDREHDEQDSLSGNGPSLSANSYGPF